MSNERDEKDAETSAAESEESPVKQPSGDDRDESEGEGVVRDEDDSPPRDTRPSRPPAVPVRFALPMAVVITVALAVVLRFAFHADQAGTWTMLIALFAAYLPLGALAAWALAKDGKLTQELKPKGGDLTFGALVAGLMYGAAMAGRQLFLSSDSPRSWWLARIYLQLGDMSNNRMLYVGLAVFVIAAIEELVWRGLVMRSLRTPFGPARAWLMSSFLYALAHASTVSLLAHPTAGPNFLLVAAALGGGLVWGHLYNRTGRLLPGIFAHALFSWAIVDFPLWRP